MTVTLSGTASFSEETNASGCAIFPFAPAGNYTATISKLGLVGWQGDNPLAPAPTLTATAGQTTTYGAYYMEQPATINAQFDTKVGSAAAQADDSRYVVVNNVKLTSQRKVFDAGSPRRPGPCHRPLPVPRRLRPLRGAVHPPERPRGRAPQHEPEPGRDVTTNPKIRVPSINIRVLTRQRGRGRARRPRPSRRSSSSPPTAAPRPTRARTSPTPPPAAWPRCPSRATRTGPTSSAPSARSQGSPPTGTPTSARAPAAAPTTHQAHQHRRRGDGCQPHRRHHQQHERKRRSGPGGQPHLSGQPRPAAPATARSSSG